MDGELTCVSTFHDPIPARLTGGPDTDVLILATGNMGGSSPVFLVLAANGDSQWLPLKRVSIVDGIFKPRQQGTYERVTAER